MTWEWWAGLMDVLFARLPLDFAVSYGRRFLVIGTFGPVVMVLRPANDE